MIERTLFVEEKDEGKRLDIFISSKLTSLSRTSACNFIKKNFISVDKKNEKPSYKIKKGDIIYINILSPSSEAASLKPENIKIDIIFQDKDIAVINKPPGMVVHPAPGNPSQTLANAILYLCPDIKGIGDALRPGIVHRLDKDTSGIIVIAKNDYALNALASQFKLREVTKKYLAIVHGIVKEEAGVIRIPIGRHKTDRKKMSAAENVKKARKAVTIWKAEKKFQDFSLLELEIKTGRTHQIRVHCSAMGHPVAGDTVYSSRNLKRKNELLNIKRQMLHSRYIEFTHPSLNKRVSFEADIFDDMKHVLEMIGQE